jgi:Gluconate 2-dehydrogenase subunit 3
MNRRDAIKTSTLFLGYTVTAGALAQIFTACQNEPKAGATTVGGFFNAEQMGLLGEITETILPKTNTPGAKEMNVPAFIDQSAKTVMTAEEQKQWVAGLKKLDDDCKAKTGKSFVKCSPEERSAYLLEIDKAAGAYPPSVWGITLVANPEPVGFFRHVKSLTLFGYFTSQKIYTEVLRYDPVPGAYLGCIPLEAGEYSWSEGG